MEANTGQLIKEKLVTQKLSSLLMLTCLSVLSELVFTAISSERKYFRLYCFVLPTVVTAIQYQVYKEHFSWRQS